MRKVNFEAPCQKCGTKGAIARWMSAKKDRDYWDYQPDWPDEEFILRACQTCGFKWNEACIETDPPRNE